MLYNDDMFSISENVYLAWLAELVSYGIYKCFYDNMITKENYIDADVVPFPLG